MSKNTKEQEIPYSYLVDNIKIFLIFLVVFNHIIAFQLVKADQVVRFVWYGITIFHMPAFIFISGYLSKKPQDVMKNVKNLLIPYILGYTLTWAAQIWLGNKMDYELLRPSGTVMWYVLALFAYRLTIEAFGKIRFIVPLSIIFALWAGTRMEFSTFLSASRIVVFFPFFVAGYLWKSEYTKVIRKFKGKIVVALFVIILLFVATNYMIGNNIPVDLFRGNHSYLASGMDNVQGMVVRGMMYLISFTVIFALLVLMPDKRHPFIFLGRNTMGIYFFHYPIMILMNGLMILNIPQLLNVWALFGVSVLFVLILGSLPSVKSREQMFFYGHPQNRFWKMISGVFEEAVPQTIEEKKAFMLKHNIAMWDTIYSCDIIGSSDSSIKNVVPTDLKSIIDNSKIEKVICNGKTSGKYYEKYQMKYLGIKPDILPSTSPANAAYSLGKLVEIWKKSIIY